jgi:hypothetical protein
MSDVSGKSRRLYNSMERRKRNQELNKGNSVPKTFLVSVIFIVVLSVLSGVWIGMQSNRVSLDQMNTSYSVEDYNIVFTSEKSDPEMVGNNGYTWIGSDTIYINKELLRENDFTQVKRTCEHELAHTIGIPEKHHDIIEFYERQVDTPVCSKLMNKIAY